MMNTGDIDNHKWTPLLVGLVICGFLVRVSRIQLALIAVTICTNTFVVNPHRDRLGLAGTRSTCVSKVKYETGLRKPRRRPKCLLPQLDTMKWILLVLPPAAFCAILGDGEAIPTPPLHISNFANRAFIQHLQTLVLNDCKQVFILLGLPLLKVILLGLHAMFVRL